MRRRARTRTYTHLDEQARTNTHTACMTSSIRHSNTSAQGRGGLYRPCRRYGPVPRVVKQWSSATDRRGWRRRSRPNYCTLSLPIGSVPYRRTRMQLALHNPVRLHRAYTESVHSNRSNMQHMRHGVVVTQAWTAAPRRASGWVGVRDVTCPVARRAARSSVWSVVECRAGSILSRRGEGKAVSDTRQSSARFTAKATTLPRRGGSRRGGGEPRPFSGGRGVRSAL